MNVDFPKPGREEALNGPYGRCEETDDWCRAYNYGYGIGREVTERAAALRISPSRYWLDIETGNYWSGNPTYNAQVIRGTIDWFKEQKLPVGIYGTPYQWRIIAGTYAPGLPIWTAGAQGVQMAASRCTDSRYAFAGGEVILVQYYDYGFDTNYACPNGHPIAQTYIPDPLGRPGPSGRATAPAGGELGFWQAVPMVAGGD